MSSLMLMYRVFYVPKLLSDPLIDFGIPKDPLIPKPIEMRLQVLYKAL